MPHHADADAAAAIAKNAPNTKRKHSVSSDKGDAKVKKRKTSTDRRSSDDKRSSAISPNRFHAAKDKVCGG